MAKTAYSDNRLSTSEPVPLRLMLAFLCRFPLCKRLMQGRRRITRRPAASQLQVGLRRHSRSIMVAVAMAPPAHMVIKERFDIRRDPNPHVGLGGFGAHYCLGASLAKLEIGLIFNARSGLCPPLSGTDPADSPPNPYLTPVATRLRHMHSLLLQVAIV
jgi:hypothetical protein